MQSVSAKLVAFFKDIKQKRKIR